MTDTRDVEQRARELVGWLEDKGHWLASKSVDDAADAIAADRAARERAEAQCRDVAKQMRAAAANTTDHAMGVGLHALADELDGSYPNPFDYLTSDQRGSHD